MKEESAKENAHLATVNFSTFVMGLASAALIEMGAMEDPSTKKKRTNLGIARQHIDLLGILKEKTRGNLSADEAELLERAVTDLKLQFVKSQNSQGK